MANLNLKKFVKSLQVICTRDLTKVLEASLCLQYPFINYLVTGASENSVSKGKMPKNTLQNNPLALEPEDFRNNNANNDHIKEEMNIKQE